MLSASVVVSSPLFPHAVRSASATANAPAAVRLMELGLTVVRLLDRFEPPCRQAYMIAASRPSPGGYGRGDIGRASAHDG